MQLLISVLTYVSTSCHHVSVQSINVHDLCSFAACIVMYICTVFMVCSVYNNLYLLSKLILP